MPDFTVIPSIERLRQRATIRALELRFGGDATVNALRHAATVVRDAIGRGDSSLEADGTVIARIEAIALARLGEQFRPSLEPVINASGVLIHTNLGRAPLAESAIERVAAVARGYSTLEYDLARRRRGRRDVPAEAPLCRLPAAGARGAGRPWQALRRSCRRGPRQRTSGGGCPPPARERRAGSDRQRRCGRRYLLLQRRQAARRSSSRHHRWTRRPGRASASAS